jgi:hypothetical protein
MMQVVEITRQLHRFTIQHEIGMIFLNLVDSHDGDRLGIC